MLIKNKSSLNVGSHFAQFLNKVALFYAINVHMNVYYVYLVLIL